MGSRRISAVRPRRPPPRVVPQPRQPRGTGLGYTGKALRAVRRVVFEAACGDLDEVPAPTPAPAAKRRRMSDPAGCVVRPGTLRVEAAPGLPPPLPPAPAEAEAEPTVEDEDAGEEGDEAVDGAGTPPVTAAGPSDALRHAVPISSWLGEGVVQLPFIDGHVSFGEAPRHSQWHLPKVPWAALKLPPVRKDFYTEHPTTAGRRPAELEPWTTKHQVMTVGEGLPKPILNFKEVQLPPQLTAPLAGYTKPSVIQALAWPVLLQGRDMVGVAETGSGKTVAFGLPAVVHASAQAAVKPGEGPIVLIVSPTRELALQILGEMQRLTVHTKLRTMCVYGGSDRGEQVAAVRQGVEVFIATAGRLMDLLQDGVTTLRRTTYFVLDEADRMLDMGFGPQMLVLRDQVRPDRQTAMFSATWPPEVQQLAAEFLSPQHVRVQIGGLALSANHNVTQHVTVCREEDKLSRLRALLATLGGKVLIFTSTRHSCKKLAAALKGLGCPVRCIHSDMTQVEREQTMAQFRRPGESLLVATDVAARGLDVCDVAAVVNHDFPATIADYIHRIGRTGRAGATGDAYSYVTQQDANRAGELVRVMREAGQAVPADLLQLQRDFEARRAERQAKRHSPGAGTAPRPRTAPAPHRQRTAKARWSR
eukprot:EG_transcript_6232